MKIVRIFFIFNLIALSILVLCSCDDKQDGVETTNYEYRTSDEATSVEEQSTILQETITKNNSWKNNYSVKYKYFNSEQGNSIMSIEEKKSQKAFTVTYIDTNTTLYYKENGANTDHYVISDTEDEQSHSVLYNKSFSSLSSMFMKISDIDENLPKQKNVLYMFDETVADRKCQKYIQRAYTGGKLTQSVYVWIDIEYGFAMKCEAYDLNDKLLVMWEVEEFSAGALSESDMLIDISKYNFKEIVG